MPESLTNVILSTNPCPKCREADGQTMTLEQWQASEWGPPGSSGRYCEDDCHCILVPEGIVPDDSEIGKRILLRGDAVSDIGPIIEIGPNEKSLRETMQKWYEAGNEYLPKEIYTMPIEEIEDYLLVLMERS